MRAIDSRVAAAAGIQPQIHVLEQQFGREGHLVERQVGQHRRLVAGVHRTEHRIVDAFQEDVARYARLLGQHGDLAQVLDDHAEHGVVRDLPDPRELALAHPDDLARHDLQDRLHALVQRAPARGHHQQLARLGHLGVARHRRTQVRHAHRLEPGADFGRAFLGDRRAVDHDLGFGRAAEQPRVCEQHLLEVLGGGHHREHALAAGQLLHGRDHLCAVLDQRLALAAGSVPQVHAMPRLEQALDHGLAHAPQSDPSDAVVHGLASCVGSKLRAAAPRERTL
jgi:hypothetical protein